MARSTVRFWISLALLLTLVFLPSAVLAQDNPPAKDEVAEEVADEADLSEEEAAVLDEASEAEQAAEGAAETQVEGEVEPEAGKGEMEGAEGAGEGEGGEGEVPEYLPVTGGSTQATTSMVVLAVFALLFGGTFVTRAFQRSRT